MGRLSFFNIPGIVPALATLTGIIIGFRPELGAGCAL